MIETLSGVTSQVARLALDAYALRHRVIASNIANHASDGYAPLALSFESHLEPLRAAALRPGGQTELAARIEDVRSRLAAVPSGASEVALDEEVTALARNTLQYQTLLAALSRLGSLNRLAIRGE